jgi:hypothetical protein
LTSGDPRIVSKASENANEGEKMKTDTHDSHRVNALASGERDECQATLSDFNCCCAAYDLTSHTLRATQRLMHLQQIRSFLQICFLLIGIAQLTGDDSMEV